MSLIRPGALALLTVLASCAPTGPGPQAGRASVASMPEALPDLRRFSGAPKAVPLPDASQLAQDFLALTFQLETGREVPRFTRFEGPVTVALEGAVPPTLGPDLDDLLARLRREAGIDIRRASQGERGSITVTALPRETLQRYVPGAACFVVPRVSGWQDYLDRRLGPDTDWTTLETRSRASVFLPADVSPQEVRDCLHEEIAQALGPLNDLYRLSHSVFNDDNVHVVLTSYDMTILKMTYDDDLRSGMTREEVVARLPAVVRRVAPRRNADDVGTGERPSSPQWVSAIRAALNPRGPDRLRVVQAKRAVSLAQQRNWTDRRLGLSYLALARASLPFDGDAALDAFVAADRVYRQAGGDDIHTAQVALQLGAFALSSGQPDAALEILDRAIPAADGAQNASLMATLLLMRAEATELKGDRAAAARIRREGLAWGRYAWGDRVLALRAAEVAGLRPRV
ncbi:MAG: DUF2927 domain-containing protein [Pseudomonadota bacterium]